MLPPNLPRKQRVFGVSSAVSSHQVATRHPFPVYHPSSGEAQLSEQLLVALDVAQPLLLELGHLVVLGLELLLLLLLARRLN